MPADEKLALLTRINKLKDAVKMAREEANGVEVKELKIGAKIFDYLLK